MNNYYSGYSNGGYSNGRYFNSPAYNMPNYQQQNYMQQSQQPNGLFFNNIRYVSPEDYDKYIVALGQTDMIINKDNGLVKIVSADMVGNSFARTFKYEEITNQAAVEPKKQDIDPDSYVKKDDLKDFIKVDTLTQFSKELDEKLDSLRKEVLKEI